MEALSDAKRALQKGTALRGIGHLHRQERRHRLRWDGKAPVVYTPRRTHAKDPALGVELALSMAV